MTTPTQAQIEAAAKALYGDHGRPPSDRAMAMAKAALAAAAEVGEPTEQNRLLKEYSYRLDKNATIERCAQVARECKPNEPDTIGMMEYRFKIAAAIRALKDKP